MPMKPCRLPCECGYAPIHDEGMASAPKTQLAAGPPAPPEAEPGHRLPCIWTRKHFWVKEVLQYQQTKERFLVKVLVIHLVCVMGREKRDVICSKVVPDLLYLPITFPFPPLGSTILEPNLETTNTQEQTYFREQRFMVTGHKIV